MNTSNTKFNMSLPIEYRPHHIFFYKKKIPTLNLLSIWSNLIPGKRKHYRKLYLNLLKKQKQIKKPKSNWIFKKKKLISSFKNNLYLDKSRSVFEQELKPKLRQFKEMYLKGYTPQEEKIFIFNTKKQNLLLRPPLLKVNNNKAQTYFSKLRQSKWPKYKIVKKPVKAKPLKFYMRAKLVENLFLKKQIKPSTLLGPSIKMKASKVRLYPLPSAKLIKAIAKAESTKTSIIKTPKTPVVRSTKVAKVEAVKS